MDTSRTLVMIPTYNERQNVPALIACLLNTVPQADILLVDDNSPDGTADLAQELFGHCQRFAILRRAGPRGLGRSYMDGYRYALTLGYAYVVQMDADFSHDPAHIPALLQAAEGADVVVGSRYCRGGGVRHWPLRRQWLSRFANSYVRTILDLPVSDATSGFRCYSRQVLERIFLCDIAATGYAFQVEMTHRARQVKARIVESPIVFTDRRQGQSKMSRQIILEAMLLPWRLRFRAYAACTEATSVSPVELRA